jgi:hypothetical protein
MTTKDDGTVACSIKGCDRAIRTKGMCASHYTQQWNQQNRDQYNANWRKHYARNTEARRRHSRDLKKLYDITESEYDVMLGGQGGVCAICHKQEDAISHIDGKPKRLAVDHDHTTGKVRALLCSTCNNGLGCFKDNPELLIVAEQYLRRYDIG